MLPVNHSATKQVTKRQFTSGHRSYTKHNTKDSFKI